MKTKILKRLGLSILSVLIVSGVAYATTSFVFFSSDISDGTTIPSSWYNSVNSRLNGTFSTTAGKFCTTDGAGKINCNTDVPTGPQGPTGPTGPTGPQGPTGPTGPAGTSTALTLSNLPSGTLAGCISGTYYSNCGCDSGWLPVVTGYYSTWSETYYMYEVTYFYACKKN